MVRGEKAIRLKAISYKVEAGVGKKGKGLVKVIGALFIFCFFADLLSLFTFRF